MPGLFPQLLGMALVAIGLWAWSEKVSVLTFRYRTTITHNLTERPTILCCETHSVKQWNVHHHLWICVLCASSPTPRPRGCYPTSRPSRTWGVWTRSGSSWWSGAWCLYWASPGASEHYGKTPSCSSLWVLQRGASERENKVNVWVLWVLCEGVLRSTHCRSRVMYKYIYM